MRKLLQQNRLTLAMSLLMLFSGCGYYGQTINSANDIQKVSSTDTWIQCRGIRDSDVPSLGRLTQIRFIDFLGGWGYEHQNITSKGFDELAELQLANLKTLHLGVSDLVTDESLHAISRIEGLQVLKIVGCDHVTGVGLAYLTSLKHIQFLDLSGCTSLTDDDIQVLSNLKHRPVVILFGGCSRLTEIGVHSLSDRLPDCMVTNTNKYPEE